MSRTRKNPDDDPHIVVTDAAGPIKLLLRPGPNSVIVSPITGQNQVVTIGDTAERADQRTPQVIWTNQQGGMSQFAYTETEGNETFTDSDCDTRYPGMVVLPPARTLIGTLGSGAGTTTVPVHIDGTTISGAQLVVWVPQIVGGTIQCWNGTTLNSPAFVSNVTGFCVYGPYLIVSVGTTDGAKYSTDGVNFTGMAFGSSCTACCVHDGKLFLWNNNRFAYTKSVTAPVWAYSTAEWPGGFVKQIFEWRDASGRTVIYVLTEERLYWWDEDTDVFHLFFDFSKTIGSTSHPWATVWRRDGNLYLTFYDTVRGTSSDLVLWFSGTTNETGPNRFQGLPATSLTSLTMGDGGQRWLYFFGAPRLSTTNTGRVMAMNDQQGWHAIDRGDSNGRAIVGGGYYAGFVYAFHNDFTIYRYSVPDNPDTPLFATGRTYRTGTTFYHEYAYTDGGTTNMPKNPRWVTVQSLNHTTAGKVPGLASGCEIDVYYQRDVDSTRTLLATLTSASTFPAQVPFPNTFGTFKQMKITLGLRSSVATNTPVVTSVALAYLRQEVRRESVTVVVDLAEGDHDFYQDQDRAQRWQRIKGWAQPGQIVALAFAGGDESGPPPTASSYSACTVEFSEYHDALSGPREMTLQFSDVSAPASG